MAIVKSGNDYSQWQGRIDWNKVKASGSEFAILRAGYGDALNNPNQIDPTFEYNYKECKRLGIPVGIYWYCYATDEASAIQEAKSCHEVIKGKQFEYPVLYDVEEFRLFRTGRTNEVIKAFADYMESREWFVGVYIYRSAAQSYLTERTRTRYTMAIAEYGPRLNYSGPYGIWQNSSTTIVPGVSGNVDHDYSYMDYPAIMKERGKNGFKKASGSTPSPSPAKPVVNKKDNRTIAQEVIAGKWSAGAERKTLLTKAGYDYYAVQKIVDELLAPKSNKKSNEEIAKEVIRGLWGAGAERKSRLTRAGYDYNAVQAIVNRMMG